MRKLLITLAALALMPAINTAFAADDAAEFNFSGELRARYSYDSLPNGVKKEFGGNRVDQRGVLGVTMRKGESLTGHATLINANRWGNQTGVDSAEGYFDGNNQANQLLVNEFWGWWKATDSLSFMVGRSGWTMADGRVISRNDYETNPTSFSNATVSWDSDFLKISLTGVKAADSELIAQNDPENVFYVLSGDFKNLPDFLKMANVHLIQHKKDTYDAAPIGTFNLGEDGWTMTRYGLTLGGEVANADYNLTYAGLTGNSIVRLPGFVKTDLSAWMFDATAGYTLPDAMSLRFWGGFHSDSGDDTSASKNTRYTGFYYDVHDNAGAMDIMRWGNLTYYRTGVSVSPLEDMQFGVEYFGFSRTKSNDGPAFDPARVFTIAPNTNKAIGSEIDITANKKYDNGMMIGARYSMFSPGAHMKFGTAVGRPTETIGEFWLEGKMKF